MELTLEHSNKVNGHGRFVASTLLIVMDYQRNSMEELRSADIENAIVDRLTKAALASLTDAGAPGVKDIIRGVYIKYRPGTSQAQTKPLFFRPTNVLQIAFSIIGTLDDVQGADKEAFPAAKAAVDAAQAGMAKAAVPETTQPPVAPGGAAAPTMPTPAAKEAKPSAKAASASKGPDFLGGGKKGAKGGGGNKGKK